MPLPALSPVLVLVLCPLLMLLAFQALSWITDKRFIPVLEQFTKSMRLPSDVAGASLMAIGTSAPELCIALIALSVSWHAIGTGTIVGSALFNLLMITGYAALVRPLRLAWQLVVRDLFFYLLAVLLLQYVMSDGRIVLGEASIFVALYVVYLMALFLWHKWLPYKDQEAALLPPSPAAAAQNGNLWERLQAPLFWLLNLLFPAPAHTRGRLILCFCGALVGIILFSLLLVQQAVLFARTVGMPEELIALTVLAIGTSIPDLLGSRAAARRGLGGMAFSNAVGSNLFDVLVGLGLLWLFSILIRGEEVVIDAVLTNESLFALVFSIVGLFCLLALNRWRVGKRIGILCIGSYVFYLLWITGPSLLEWIEMLFWRSR